MDPVFGRSSFRRPQARDPLRRRPAPGEDLRERPGHRKGDRGGGGAGAPHRRGGDRGGRGALRWRPRPAGQGGPLRRRRGSAVLRRGWLGLQLRPGGARGRGRLRRRGAVPADQPQGRARGELRLRAHQGHHHPGEGPAAPVPVQGKAPQRHRQLRPHARVRHGQGSAVPLRYGGRRGLPVPGRGVLLHLRQLPPEADAAHGGEL